MPKLKSHLLDNKYKVSLAFTWAGVDYYQFDSQFDIPTDRAMAALTIYDELRMRCDRAYLEKHVKAVDIILSDPKKINIGALALIHHNLGERLNVAPFPDYIYRLASVSYFDKSESVYSYDFAYNEKKIQKWKEAPGTLDFFLKGPLKELLPYLPQQEGALETFLQTQDLVNKYHQKDLSTVISKHEQKNGSTASVT